MNVLITGSMGQLGRSFRRSFLNLDHECFFTDLHGSEDVVPLDITDAEAVNAIYNNINNAVETIKVSFVMTK